MINNVIGFLSFYSVYISRRLLNVFKRTVLPISKSSETIAFHSRHPSVFNPPPLSSQASIFVPRSKSKFCFCQNDENSKTRKKDGLVKVDSRKKICDPTPCNVKPDDKANPQKNVAIEVPESPVKLINPIIVWKPTVKPTHRCKMSDVKSAKKIDCVTNSMDTSSKPVDVTRPGKVDNCNSSPFNDVNQVKCSNDGIIFKSDDKPAPEKDFAIEIPKSPVKLINPIIVPTAKPTNDRKMSNAKTVKKVNCLGSSMETSLKHVDSTLPVKVDKCNTTVVTETSSRNFVGSVNNSQSVDCVQKETKSTKSVNRVTEKIKLKNSISKCATNVESPIPMSLKDCGVKNVATEKIEPQNVPSKCATNVKSSISTCPKDGVIKNSSECTPNPLDLSELVKPFKSWKYIEEIQRENTSTQLPNELNGKPVEIKDSMWKTITESIKLWMEYRLKKFKK